MLLDNRLQSVSPLKINWSTCEPHWLALNTMCYVDSPLRSHWGGGVSTPHPLEWDRKRPLKPLLFDFPLPLGKRLVTALGRVAPIGAFPVGASSFIVVGITKGLILIGSKTL